MTIRNPLWVLAAAVFSLPVLADPGPEPIEGRHGAVIMPEHPVAVEGGMTAVLQAADDSRVDSELTASFDLVTTLPAGGGNWIVYVEGNTTPSKNSVSQRLGEANADAGSALDRDGKGQLQVSELHYLRVFGAGALAVGLLDVTASLDNSAVANDETTQFLSNPLVNNPTIGFPDYSLGVVYNHETGPDRGYTLALTSSHGLADNPHVSYAQLTDVSARGKGVFAAAEGQWPQADSQLRLGAWVNTADHPRLNGRPGTEQNYGLYLVADGHWATGLWNLRAGLANEAVSPASYFLSAAMERPLNKATLGLGIAYTGLSDHYQAPQRDDMLLAEVYLRFVPRHHVSFSPAVQWLNNSGFDSSGSVVDAEQLLLSFRLNYTF